MKHNSGWRGESKRHSDAKRYGHAGGKYHARPHSALMQTHLGDVASNSSIVESLKDKRGIIILTKYGMILNHTLQIKEKDGNIFMRSGEKKHWTRVGYHSLEQAITAAQREGWTTLEKLEKARKLANNETEQQKIISNQRDEINKELMRTPVGTTKYIELNEIYGDMSASISKIESDKRKTAREIEKIFPDSEVPK